MFSYDTRKQKAMRLLDKISAAPRWRSSSCRDKRRLAMWLRITSLALALALAASVALGTPLHSSERSCSMPMSMDMEGCEHMGMDPSAPAVTSTPPLCCLLNCPEPGPTGSAFSFQIPTFNGAFLDQVALVPPLTLPKPFPQSNWVQTSPFTPPETYLRNLALLI